MLHSRHKPVKLSWHPSTLPPQQAAAASRRASGTCISSRSMTASHPVQMKWTWGSVLPSKRSMPLTVATLLTNPCCLNKLRFRYTVPRDRSGISGLSWANSVSAEGWALDCFSPARMALRLRNYLGGCSISSPLLFKNSSYLQ